MYEFNKNKRNYYILMIHNKYNMRCLIRQEKITLLIIKS